MHAPHDGADQPLDVTAIVRRANRSPNEFYSLLTAGPREGPASEVGAIVRMKRFREPRHRPTRIDRVFLEPSAFLVDSVQHAKTDGHPGRLIHRQMEPDHHAGAKINRQ